MVAVPGSASWWGAAAAIVVLLGATACSDRDVDPTATEACPEPVHPTGGHRSVAVSAALSGTYEGELPRGSDGSLHVALDDGRGGPATTVTACQAVELRFDLAAARPSASATVTPGRFSVTSAGGGGRLALVDQQTVIDDYGAAGYAAGSWAQLTGWYITVDDPEPGTYVVERDVVWSQQLGEREGVRRSPGTVTLTITLT